MAKYERLPRNRSGITTQPAPAESDILLDLELGSIKTTSQTLNMIHNLMTEVLADDAVPVDTRVETFGHLMKAFHAAVTHHAEFTRRITTQ